MEMAGYEPVAFKKLDSVAFKVVSNIRISNLTKKRDVMAICIEYYNGKELDEFVMRLDTLRSL